MLELVDLKNKVRQKVWFIFYFRKPIWNRIWGSSMG